MWWNKLQQDIIHTDLFTRSGTEVGVSGGVLKLIEEQGDYIIKKICDGDIPSDCYTMSTDLGIDYPALNIYTFGKLPQNWLIGNYEKIYIGYFNDEEIRNNGASAGILSGLQLYLVESGKADGAITLQMRKDKPYLTKPVVATSREEILAGAQSKYTISPINQILSELSETYQSLVYTGLPEQIAAIRKLQMKKHPIVAPITYVFGTFYGESLGPGAIYSFLRSYGVTDPSEVVSLQYRAGEWPGNMRVELKSGRVISVRKFHANYLIPSHITPYSLYQVDYMSELADVSVGDAWAPTYEQRGEGWSVVIARTKKGLELIESLREKGKVVLDEIGEEDLINMHSHGLDLKKRGAFIRIEKRKKKGLPAPEYGYRPVNIPAERIRFETLLGWLFVLFQSKITIWVLEKIPPQIIGWFFIRARNIWKMRTKSTKKGSLKHTEFEIT